MVLLVLAVLWAIVLVPPALRSAAERKRTRSVDSFRRRLSVLALPETNRLAVVARPEGAARPLGSARPAAANVVALPWTAPPVPPVAALPTAPLPPTSPVPRLGRRAVLRRRRRALAVLTVAVGATFVVGLVPGLRFVWAFHVLVDLAAGAYLVGLVRLRRLAVERRAKVRYLPRPAPAMAVPVVWTEDSPTIPLRTAAFR